MLEFAGLLHQLDVLITNEDVTQAKPAPDIYLKACAELGVAPARTVVVEDHDYGVQAAKAAGCRVLQVSGVEAVNTGLLQPVFADLDCGLAY